MDGGRRCPARRNRRNVLRQHARATSWAREMLRQFRGQNVYALRATISALRWLLAEAEALLEDREALAEGSTSEASGAEAAGTA